MKPIDSLPYRFIGRSADGLLVFEDLVFPSDAPRSLNMDDDTLLRCRSTDAAIDGNRYFAVTERHAQVRGFLHLALGGTGNAGAS